MDSIYQQAIYRGADCGERFTKPGLNLTMFISPSFIKNHKEIDKKQEKRICLMAVVRNKSD